MRLYSICVIVLVTLIGNSLTKEQSKENEPDMDELMNMVKGLSGQAGPILEGLLKGDKSGSGDKKGSEDLSSLLSMAGNFLGESGILDSLKDGKDSKDVPGKDGDKSKLKNKLKREGADAVNQNWMLKLLNDILGTDTAFDLVPYMFRDNLSDFVKKKLKNISEEDMLKLKKVYDNMEKFEGWADVLDDIEKQAPKFYEVAVELYKAGKTKFNALWSSLDNEPKKFISQIRTDFSEVINKSKKSLVSMSQDGQKNLRDTLGKFHPGLKTFLDRLMKNKGVLVMYLNSIFEQQPELLEAVNNKKEATKNPDSDKEEL
ncbi:nematode fatty acid retinoid binding protein (Gp-FAR-1) domain-containing protein [Ditylenchus destructor]|nr:nematode fatty acid retinoid binding protein (Gp-FAR-1) domain-containing protein [Ditylenchus destructor]